MAKEARAAANAQAEKYVEFVLEARRLCDGVKNRYAELADDPMVQAVVDKYNASSAKKHELGPSRYFLGDERKLKKLEGTVLSEQIEIRRGAGNLWYVSVMFNGKFAQEMAIDTGASAIALPWRIAQSAGLEPADDDPTVHLQMADGRVIEGKKVTAKTVRVGKFTVDNVECVVMPSHLVDAEPLLGLSYLKHFSFKIDTVESRLILSKIETTDSKN